MMIRSGGMCGLGIDIEGAGTHSFGISWEFFSTPDCFRYLMSMLEAGSLYPSHTRESIEAGNPGGFKFADFAPGGKYAGVPVYDRLQYQKMCYMGGGQVQQEDAAKQWQALVAQYPSLATPSTAVAAQLAAQAVAAGATVAVNGAAEVAADSAAQTAADAAKKIAANGGATAGFDLTKFLKDNQTLLLIGAAGIGALFLWKSKKGVG